MTIIKNVDKIRKLMRFWKKFLVYQLKKKLFQQSRTICHETQQKKNKKINFKQNQEQSKFCKVYYNDEICKHSKKNWENYFKHDE